MMLMLRTAQVDSSDGARVRAWIREYTGYMSDKGTGAGVTVRSWTEMFGAYGRAYWTFEAPDLVTLEGFLDDLSGEASYGDILVRGSELFVSGMTRDSLLRST